MIIEPHAKKANILILERMERPKYSGRRRIEGTDPEKEIRENRRERGRRASEMRLRLSGRQSGVDSKKRTASQACNNSGPRHWKSDYSVLVSTLLQYS